MITNAFLYLASTVASTIVNILPVSNGFSSEILSSAQSLGGYFGLFSPIIPIGTLATAVGVAFSTEILIFGWKTVKSLISHIPQFGGAGH